MILLILGIVRVDTRVDLLEHHDSIAMRDVPEIIINLLMSFFELVQSHLHEQLLVLISVLLVELDEIQVLLHVQRVLQPEFHQVVELH